MQNTKTAIVWFTNNLRVQNNVALYEACMKYDSVIGVFCFTPNMFTKTQFGFRKIEKYRAKFLIESVEDLSKNLTEKNIPFYIAREHPKDAILNIFSIYNADALFLQKEFTSEEVHEINKVKKALPESIKVYEYYDQFLFHPDDIAELTNTIPEIFTSFRKKVEKYTSVRKEVFIDAKPKEFFIDFKQKTPTLEELGFESFILPIHTAFPFSGGETSVKERLTDYFFTRKRLGVYKKTRNGLIGRDYSSKFSPWLANGSISAQTIYWQVKKYEEEFGSNQSTYWLIFELIWRDYFKFLSMKHQHNLFKLEGIKKLDYLWNTDEKLVQSWIDGETNEPFVNANMIELKETGWMSNRGRQNVASYFAKELLLDWRIGASYFESMLIDYDVHSNYGNWQYVAGVGNDPRDRKFNIKLQAQRYDEKGKYQRMWLQPSLF